MIPSKLTRIYRELKRIGKGKRLLIFCSYLFVTCSECGLFEADGRRRGYDRELLTGYDCQEVQSGKAEN